MQYVGHSQRISTDHGSGVLPAGPAGNVANQRVSQVYFYTAAALGTTFSSACVFAQAGLAGRFVAAFAASTWMTGIGALALGIVLLTSTYFAPNESSLKKGLFGTFALWQGVCISPLVLINAPAFAGAAAVTVALTAGLGALAAKCQTQFRNYETALQWGLGGIFVASIGALALGGVAGAVAHRIALLGGLALFSAYVIHDVQEMREGAALQSEGSFDPINHSLNIYLDSMNLFVRIWEIWNSLRERV